MFRILNQRESWNDFDVEYSGSSSNPAGLDHPVSWNEFESWSKSNPIQEYVLVMIHIWSCSYFLAENGVLFSEKSYKIGNRMIARSEYPIEAPYNEIGIIVFYLLFY